MNSIWLFRFTSYSYCQGTRDKNYGDLRLLKFTLPCEVWEAKNHLDSLLKSQSIEYDFDSVEALTFNVTNS